MTAVDKGKQVQDMFDELAPNYDLMNRVMTLGQDQRWRRYVVDQAKIEDGRTVLDLASGTGDIAFEIKRRYPLCQVVAADFSLGMLRQGKLRPGGERLHWVACDALNLPFPDNSFDAITFGYLLRNVTDIHACLLEVARVLKPGGRVVCLDTMPPPPSLMRPLLKAYLQWGLPLLGRLIAGNTSAYTYLSSSTLAFKDPESLKAIFERAGFEQVHWQNFMFRTIAVHQAVLPA